MLTCHARRALTGVLLSLVATVATTARAQALRFSVRSLTPNPLAPQLGAVRFIDARTALAAGDHGAVFRSIDSGTTWTRVATGIETPLKALAFTERAGFAAGAEGVILRTADSGSTWSIVARGDSVEWRAAAIGGGGATTLVVGTRGALRRSSDGGSTWQSASAGTTATLRSATFVDDHTAIVVGDDGVILRSTDAGARWTPVASGTSAALRGVYFADAKRGVIVGGDDRRWRSINVVLRTTDGGATWTSVRSPVKKRLYSVSGFDSLVVAVGEEGTLLRSADAGASWQRDTTVRGGWLGAVAVTYGARGLAVGADGRILLAPKNASAWKPVRKSAKDINGTISSVARPRDGLLVISTAPQQGGNAPAKLFRSLDGGATFTAAKVDTTARPIIHVTFRDSLVGIAAGISGTIIRTTDGGATWTKVKSGTQRNLWITAFADSTTAVVVGAFGGGGAAMLRTTDAGLTWKPLKNAVDGVMFAVDFKGPRFGLAVGGAGTILLSRDAGATWIHVRHGLTRTILRGVAVLDERTAVAVGDEGVVLRTTDGAATWQRVDIGTTHMLWALHFANAKFGVAVGMGERAFATHDGGATWQAVPLGFASHLASLYATERSVIIGGNNSILLHLDLESRMTP